MRPLRILTGLLPCLKVPPPSPRRDLRPLVGGPEGGPQEATPRRDLRPLVGGPEGRTSAEGRPSWT
jgi:hypothetical protein